MVNVEKVHVRGLEWSLIGWVQKLQSGNFDWPLGITRLVSAKIGNKITEDNIKHDKDWVTFSQPASRPKNSSCHKSS